MTNAAMIPEIAKNSSDQGQGAVRQTGETGPISAATLSLLVVSIIALLGGVLAFYASVYSLHQDLAGSALSARLAKSLGSAFEEYSLYFPPVEHAWFGVAVSLSDLTGLRLDLCVMAMTNLAVLFSSWLAYHIRRTATGTSPVFLLVSLALLTVLPVLFKNVFGLREHMVVLGLWPYLVLRLSDPDETKIDRKTRFVVSAWLGVSLLFKYIYALVVLLVEVVDALVQRRLLVLFRIENLISASVVALYLFLWLGVDPAQREAMGAIVSAIDGNLADFETNVAQAVMNMALSVVFLIVGLVFKVPVRISAMGIALVVAAVLASWVQGRWYSHHLFPITMAYFAWIWMLRGHLRPLWQWAFLLLAFGPVVGEFRNTAIYQRSTSELYVTMANAGLSVEGKRVGLLTMHPSPFNEFLATHGAVRWNTSMNNAYVAAELKNFDRPENQDVTPPAVLLEDPGRQLLHDNMLRLWEDQPPEILILDHSHSWPLRYVKVRWQEAFAKDARFQSFLDRYEPVFKHKGELLEFTYLVRKQ